MKQVKKAKACKDIHEIRDALDTIDLELIQLLAQRHEFITEIVKFKKDEEGIVAQERKDRVISQRKTWAEENGLDPDLIEKVFELLINKNIQIQFDIYKNKVN